MSINILIFSFACRSAIPIISLLTNSFQISIARQWQHFVALADNQTAPFYSLKFPFEYLDFSYHNSFRRTLFQGNKQVQFLFFFLGCSTIKSGSCSSLIFIIGVNSSSSLSESPSELTVSNKGFKFSSSDSSICCKSSSSLLCSSFQHILQFTINTFELSYLKKCDTFEFIKYFIYSVLFTV